MNNWAYFAEDGKDDSAFDDRLAALKAAKKQTPYGASRKEKDEGPKQGEKPWHHFMIINHVLDRDACPDCRCANMCDKVTGLTGLENYSVPAAESNDV